MKLALTSCVLTAALALAVAGDALAQKKRGDKAKAEPAATGPLATDKGKYKITFDGQAVGTEEFSIAPSGTEWVSRGSVEIKIPGGGTTKVSSELRMTADGAPLFYEWSSEGQKKVAGAIKFAGNGATMEVRTDAAMPFTQEFQFESPRVVILDNNLYHHYAVLARLFDWNAKGVQTFSVLIPQDLTPGIITVEWAGPQEVEGAKAELLRVRSADLEVELYVDSGRLIHLAVPTAKVDVKRE